MSARNTLIIKENRDTCYSLIQQCDSYNILFRALDLLYIENKDETMGKLVKLSNNMSIKQKPNYYQKDFLENIWIIDFYNYCFYTIEDKSNLFNFNLLSFKALSLFYLYNPDLLKKWVFSDIIQDILVEKSGYYYSIFKNKDRNIIWFFINKLVNNDYNIIWNDNNLNFKDIDIQQIKFKIKTNNGLEKWKIKHNRLNKISSLCFLYKDLLTQNISPGLTEINWYLAAEKFCRKTGYFSPDDRYKDIKLFFENSPQKIQRTKIKKYCQYNFSEYSKKIL